LKNLPTEKPSDAAGFLCTFLVEIIENSENYLRFNRNDNKKFPFFVENIYKICLCVE